MRWNHRWLAVAWAVLLGLAPGGCDDGDERGEADASGRQPDAKVADGGPGPDGGDADGGPTTDAGDARQCAAPRILCCNPRDNDCSDWYVDWDGERRVGDPFYQHYGCVDPNVSTMNCGECGNQCGKYPFPADDGSLVACEDGVCAPPGACFDEVELPVSCSELCASRGETCIEDGCRGTTVRYGCMPSEVYPGKGGDSCDDPVTEIGSTFQSVFCCCSG